MNQFRKFMYGRYGIDLFSQALVVISIIVSLLGSVFDINGFILLSYLALVYAVFRALSKNIYKRTQENLKFTKAIYSWKQKFPSKQKNQSRSKNHKYYKCPQCRQTIRVPKGKGKINITCPKCKAEFIKNT